MLNKLKARGLGWLPGGVALGLIFNAWAADPGVPVEPSEDKLGEARRELYEKEVTEVITRGVRPGPERFSTNPVAMDGYHRQERRREQGLKEAQRLLLVDPNNFDAKLVLATFYYTTLEDAAQRERGLRLLEELAAGTNRQMAAQAIGTLNADISVIDRNGKNVVIPAVKKRAERKVTFVSPPPTRGAAYDQPPFKVVSTFSGHAVRIIRDGQHVLALDKELFLLNEQSGKLEKVNLPEPLKFNISALASDEDSWWLGTEGGGLVRVWKSGGAAKVYTEADGLLMPSITALCRSGERLWVGFGFRNSGGLGYLDVPSGKFVGVTDDVALFKSPTNDLTAPPAGTVYAMQPGDENTMWLNTYGRVQQYDSISGAVRQGVAAGCKSFVVNSNHLVTSDERGGISIQDRATERWEKMSFSENDLQNTGQSLCIDGQYLWVGGTSARTHGYTKIWLIDLVAKRIIGQYAFKDVGSIWWISVRDEEVWFLGGDAWGESKICRFARPMVQGGRAELAVQAKAEETEIDFLQANFSKFEPAQFQKDPEQATALMQTLHANGRGLRRGDLRYCGIRFTVPDWVDGDFSWMFVLKKNQDQADKVYNHRWQIIPERGPVDGWTAGPGLFQMTEMEGRYPELQKQFPHTKMVITQKLAGTRLVPGGNYAIYFCYEETDPPDIAFAMTFGSQWGERELGALPLK